MRAEEALKTLDRAIIYRLPGVFGKWSKPNYNSVVSTFAYNCVNGLNLEVNDASKVIKLVYIDEVVNLFLQNLKEQPLGIVYPALNNCYEISLGDLPLRCCSSKKIIKRIRFQMLDQVWRGRFIQLFLVFLNLNSFISRESQYR